MLTLINTIHVSVAFPCLVIIFWVLNQCSQQQVLNRIINEYGITNAKYRHFDSMVFQFDSKNGRNETDFSHCNSKYSSTIAITISLSKSSLSLYFDVNSFISSTPQLQAFHIMDLKSLLLLMMSTAFFSFGNEMYDFGSNYLSCLYLSQVSGHMNVF